MILAGLIFLCYHAEMPDYATYDIARNMKIYVAGKDAERAQSVMQKLRESGYEITFDWLIDLENQEDHTEKASDEREGVRDADVLVYLWESDQESARYEAGMAMGLKKPIIVSGKKESFFFLLPEVIIVDDDKEIYKAIDNLQK